MGRNKDRTASHDEDEEEECEDIRGGLWGRVEDASRRKEDEAMLIEKVGTMEKRVYRREGESRKETR